MKKNELRKCDYQEALDLIDDICVFFKEKFDNGDENAFFDQTLFLEDLLTDIIYLLFESNSFELSNALMKIEEFKKKLGKHE